MSLAIQLSLSSVLKPQCPPCERSRYLLEVESGQKAVKELPRRSIDLSKQQAVSFRMLFDTDCCMPRFALHEPR